MTFDLVFPVVASEENEELRYALRSVCANARPLFDRVWIVGTLLPKWLMGVGVIEASAPSRNADIRAKATAAALHPGVAPRFVLMNDDTFLVEPVTSWPTFHMGPMVEWQRRLDREGRSSGWRRAVDLTAAWAAEHGDTGGLAWQGHRPLLWDKARMAAALTAYPDQPLDPIGLYGVAGAIRDGRRGLNAKARNDAEYQSKRTTRNTPWWSSNSTSWSGDLGADIRAMFPERCEFEEA